MVDQHHGHGAWLGRGRACWPGSLPPSQPSSSGKGCSRSLLSLCLPASFTSALPRGSTARPFLRAGPDENMAFRGQALWRSLLLSLLLTQIDKILLSRLLTLEAFGYYALAGVVAFADIC
jgi:hypothetical protein